MNDQHSQILPESNHDTQHDDDMYNIIPTLTYSLCEFDEEIPYVAVALQYQQICDDTTHDFQIQCQPQCNEQEVQTAEPEIHTTNRKHHELHNIYTLTLIRSSKSPEKMDITQNEIKYDNQGSTLISHKIYGVNINMETYPKMISVATQSGQIFLKKNKVTIVRNHNIESHMPPINTSTIKEEGSIHNDKTATEPATLNQPIIDNESPPQIIRALTRNNESKTLKKVPERPITEHSEQLASRNGENEGLGNEMTHTSKQNFSIQESDKGASKRNVKQEVYNISNAKPPSESESFNRTKHSFMEFKPMGIYSQNVPSIIDVRAEDETQKYFLPNVKEKRNQSLDQRYKKQYNNDMTNKNLSPFNFQPSSYVSPNFPNNSEIVNNFVDMCKQKRRSLQKRRALKKPTKLNVTQQHPENMPELDGKLIDWSNSVMYYNIKNGISSFNHDKKEDVYQEYEIEYIIGIFKEKVGADEYLISYQEKIKRTIKKLARELCVPHFYNQVTTLYGKAIFSDVLKLFEKAQLLFNARRKIEPLLTIVAERELLVNKDIQYLINQSHSSLNETQKTSLYKYVDKLKELDGSIKSQVAEVRAAFQFMNMPFYLNKIV